MVVNFKTSFNRILFGKQNSNDTFEAISYNPIESTFATVKHRTRQTRGCFSRSTILAAFFKLIMQAQKRWHRLKGHEKCQDVVNLTKYIDGVAEDEIDQLKVSRENAA